MQKYFIFLVSLFSLFSCEKKKLGYKSLLDNEVKVLDLSNLENPIGVSVDSIFQDPEYIKLETTNQSLIGQITKMYIENDSIYIMESSVSQQAVFVFNIKGDFLYKIDAKGSGPGEYLDIDDFYINKENKEIGILSQSQIYKYDFHGNFIEKLNLRDYGIQQVSYRNNLIYTYGVYSSLVSEGEYILRAFNNKGDLVYSDYPINRSLSELPVAHQRHLSSSGEKTYLSPFYNDTIFEVGDNYIKPSFVLNFGKYKLPQEEINNFLNSKDAVEYYTDIVNKNYVLFGLNHIQASDNYIVGKFIKSRYIYTLIYSLKTGNFIVYDAFNRNNTDLIKLPISNNFIDDNYSYNIIPSEMLYQEKDLIEKGVYDNPVTGKREEYKPGKIIKEFYEEYLKDYTSEDNPIIMKVKIKDF